jgi:hypothetical protein
MSYEKADVFIVTYSVIDPPSFHSIRDVWWPEVRCVWGVRACANLAPSHRLPVSWLVGRFTACTPRYRSCLWAPTVAAERTSGRSRNSGCKASDLSGKHSHIISQPNKQNESD